ncbi:FAD-binding oxidoreductase [Sphingobacterium sp. E70]|uniref:NAD(P)/FAD-dependent oxidoreductase n=1 Tax=Sphingobacterium sp. E70 TaxID=2853439 RepID=UPI00211CB425|nr:FAD-dependent oxidoreductase [Sphingobacterium sp. E70]ULT24689.1 FAD-binding oxidoreductase [Sphingobacterium sp. E70]
MDLKSNEPFWLIKNGLLATYPSLHQDKTCDILIVGGGITGALIAHQCMAMGKNCVLIDKREIANGSSAATTSMLQYEIDTPLYELKKLIGEEGAIASYKACSKAIDDIGLLTRKIKSKAGFRAKESLYYAARKKDIPWLKQEFHARESAGFAVNWLSAAEIQAQYGLANVYGGILSGQGASMDAFCFTHELLVYNVKAGLEVFDKTELVSVKSNGQGTVVTVSTGATIRTKKLYIARAMRLFRLFLRSLWTC